VIAGLGVLCVHTRAPLGDGTFADLLRFDLLADEWDAAPKPRDEPESQP
jgi:hypothetical protein